jgi:hypothetical protein
VIAELAQLIADVHAQQQVVAVRRDADVNGVEARAGGQPAL